jgi:hypothetical protein
MSLLYAVAPGPTGHNLLSKRNLFRIVLLRGTLADELSPIEGPLVIESEDRSYHLEIGFDEAMPDGEHLVFDIYLKERDKKYAWYFKDRDRIKSRLEFVPKKLIALDDLRMSSQTR